MGWRHYGGRGITVCDRWRGSFENFIADMGARPAGLTLDRINVDGNYEPSNCRWATQTTQQRNRRNNRKLAIGEEVLCSSEWAERVGLRPRTLGARLRKMAPAQAVSMPLQHPSTRSAR